MANYIKIDLKLIVFNCTQCLYTDLVNGLKENVCFV